MKHNACKDAGIATFDRNLEETVSEEELVSIVTELANNPDVHGILVQMPLPDHINEEVLIVVEQRCFVENSHPVLQRVLGCIPDNKDVDGFSPTNVGLLCMRGRSTPFKSCTPAGCMELLAREGVSYGR